MPRIDPEIRVYIDWLQQRDEELKKQLDSLVSERQRDRGAAQLDALKQILGTQFREASGYTNLVILGGYAGIFALWQFMNSQLPVPFRLAVAILMTFSVTLFSAYELFKMMRHERLQAKLRRLLRHAAAQEQLAMWGAAENEFQVGESRLWPWFLVPTAWSGLMAGVILLVCFIAQVAARL